MPRVPTVRRPLRLILVVASMALVASVFIAPMAKAVTVSYYWKGRSKTEYSKVSNYGDGTCKFAQLKHTWEEEWRRVVDNAGRVVSDKATGKKRNERWSHEGYVRKKC
jgi:hypothetical protein